MATLDEFRSEPCYSNYRMAAACLFKWVPTQQAMTDAAVDRIAFELFRNLPPGVTINEMR